MNIYKPCKPTAGHHSQSQPAAAAPCMRMHAWFKHSKILVIVQNHILVIVQNSKILLSVHGSNLVIMRALALFKILVMICDAQEIDSIHNPNFNFNYLHFENMIFLDVLPSIDVSITISYDQSCLFEKKEKKDQQIKRKNWYATSGSLHITH
jgi:hypothetical protein